MAHPTPLDHAAHAGGPTIFTHDDPSTILKIGIRIPVGILNGF